MAQDYYSDSKDYGRQDKPIDKREKLRAFAQQMAPTFNLKVVKDMTW